MISRYDGTCCFCGKKTLANVDEYDLDSKKSFHVECRDNQPPGPESFKLADELGFE